MYELNYLYETLPISGDVTNRLLVGVVCDYCGSFEFCPQCGGIQDTHADNCPIKQEEEIIKQELKELKEKDTKVLNFPSPKSLDLGNIGHKVSQSKLQILQEVYESLTKLYEKGSEGDRWSKSWGHGVLDAGDLVKDMMKEITKVS